MPKNNTDKKTSITSFYSKLIIEEFSLDKTKTVYLNENSKTNEIPDTSMENIVLEMILNRVYNYQKMISECKRILVSDGRLVATVSSIVPVNGSVDNIWGFTPASVKFIFEKYFSPKTVKLKYYGNVLAGRYLLEGKNVNEVSEEKLLYVDPFFPVVTGIEVIKK